MAYGEAIVWAVWPGEKISPVPAVVGGEYDKQENADSVPLETEFAFAWLAIAETPVPGEH